MLYTIINCIFLDVHSKAVFESFVIVLLITGSIFLGYAVKYRSLPKFQKFKNLFQVDYDERTGTFINEPYTPKQNTAHKGYYTYNGNELNIQPK